MILLLIIGWGVKRKKKYIIILNFYYKYEFDVIWFSRGSVFRYMFGVRFWMCKLSN